MISFFFRFFKGQRPPTSSQRGRSIYDLSIRNTVVLDWTNCYIQSPERTPPKALTRDLHDVTVKQLRVVLERLPEPIIHGRRKLFK
jgi:hypothetical protein